MPYTWRDIFLNARDHPEEKHIGKGSMQKTLKINGYTVSIVGGSEKLYGNFFDTFEVAVFDRRMRLSSRFFTSHRSVDVAKDKSMDEVVELLNLIENAE